jgi:hypothetical protein
LFSPAFLIVLFCSVMGAALLLLTDAPLSWDDGLRHITMARVMLAEGIPQTWDRFLYGGYLGTHALDPWFLADVSYIPFTVFPDPVALKLYAAVALTALLLAFHRCLRPLALSQAQELFLLLVLFEPMQFTGRLLIGRPFPWVTALTLLTLDALLRRRWGLVGALLILATLFSQLFVFPLAVGVLGVLWYAARGDRKSATRLCLAAALGVLLGFAFHPHRFAYLTYIATAFLRIPIVGTSGVDLSSEMGPGFFFSVPILAVLGAVAILSVGARANGVRVAVARIHAGGTSLVALLVLALLPFFAFAWIRLIDLLWPLTVLLLAHVFALLRPFVVELTALRISLPLVRGVRIGTLLTVLIVLIVATSTGGLLRRFSATDDSRAMAHLQPLAELPAGARVLSPEWYFFPAFIASNPHVRFSSGIDNAFSWLEDPEAYALFNVPFSSVADITPPVIDAEAWFHALLERSPSDYLVLSRLRNPVFLPVLRSVPALTELTASGAGVAVFRIDVRER